jgi:hypothetical protein
MLAIRQAMPVSLQKIIEFSANSYASAKEPNWTEELVKCKMSD